MRKLFGLFIALTMLSCNSQDELTFKVKYNPQTKYSQTIIQTDEGVVKYSGTDEFLQKLKDKGVPNPKITKTESKTESVFKTGKLTDGTHFPLTIEFVKTTNSNGKKDIPDGTIFYGNGSIGNMPTLDSISSTELSVEFKKTLLQTVQSTFSQITFPEKNLKVGEEFSKESPLSMPIASESIDISITTKYKLLKIDNDVATFDITQVYTMKSTILKYEATMTGDGKGQLLYDIKNNFYKKYQIDTNMKMHEKLDNFDLDLDSKSSFVQTTIITTN